MLNNHNIILLFSDFYNILSFSWLLLMRKSFYHEVIKYGIFFRIVSRNSLDPDPNPDSDFWLDPDSMNMDPKHCCGGGPILL